jgi:hypothetical protein
MKAKKPSEITTANFTPPHPLKTAVLFVIFNRPNTTKQVFEAIRKAKPPRLYVAADGPRADKPGEAEKVEQVRWIATQVDWDGEVKTLFRDENLGCRKGVSTAIDWFFENEEEGIILEDDCLPSQSFFWYCEELLERYREDMRIMAVSGDNFQKGHARNEFSYYFSRFNHCWGWASWRRAWSYYEKNMQSWPYIRDNNYLQDILLDKTAVQYWNKIFETAYRNKIDSWAYRWTFSCWIQNGLTVLPNVNLVSNIGFGEDGTHTSGDSPLSKMAAFELSFPLKHPNWMIKDKRADDYTQKTIFNQPNIFYRVISPTTLLIDKIT